jgi:hypothetical protein
MRSPDHAEHGHLPAMGSPEPSAGKGSLFLLDLSPHSSGPQAHSAFPVAGAHNASSSSHFGIGIRRALSSGRSSTSSEGSDEQLKPGSLPAVFLLEEVPEDGDEADAGGVSSVPEVLSASAQL